ncbi:MAG: heavy metal-binding domain-containing protein [Cytophagales bacterium]|nr:heavy metal-binding domain-containing protein [Cytophagales bacterium]
MKKLLYYVLLISLLSACTGKVDRDLSHVHSAATQYTCPMHPTVIADTPGKCPVCGMDLVPKMETTTKNNNWDLMLSDTQVKLANVTIQEVGTRIDRPKRFYKCTASY